MPTRTCKPRSAFTLVELLVVIAIIALLVAILMPSLDRAKELTRVAVCASNLHQIGLIAPTFAADHTLRLPGGTHRRYDGRWWLPGSGHQIRLGSGGLEGTPGGYPIEGHDEYDPYSGGMYPPPLKAWQAFGTSYDTYSRYADLRKLGDCPGNDRAPILQQWPADNTGWLRVDYAIVMAMHVPVGREHEYAWTFDDSVPPPMLRTSDGSASDRILAADLVMVPPEMWSWHPNWANWAQVNHATALPDAGGVTNLVPWVQNRVMADGHVERLTEADYPNGLHELNASMPTYNHYSYFWHGS